MKIFPVLAFNGLQVFLSARRGVQKAALAGIFFAAVRAHAHA
jgi:hypothetical protein